MNMNDREISKQRILQEMISTMTKNELDLIMEVLNWDDEEIYDFKIAVQAFESKKRLE